MGTKTRFDSGVVNNGGTDSDVVNIKWFVDGREVGAYGSDAGVPAGRTVLDGNSQFDWTFDAPGSYQVEFRVDVDGHVAESDENNNATSIGVTVPDPVGNANPNGNGGPGAPPTFVCVRGPNGGCNGVADPQARTDAPTWNQYLDYLDGLHDAVGGVDSRVSCVRA